MNIREELQKAGPGSDGLYFNPVDVVPDRIYAVLINEVVPEDPGDDFYGGPDAAYLTTALPLFQEAGIRAGTILDILSQGIYLTNAVKMPKPESTVDRSLIEQSLPFLEKELSLFPNLKVIMLMGDVAKKAFNMISRKTARKNAVPSVSTYKIRHTEIYWQGIRIMPSYIMTGQNILIEKSKFAMAGEDIVAMYRIIH